MAEIALVLALVNLLAVLFVLVWCDGVSRRVDRVDDMAKRCQQAIATSRHIAYDDLDMELKNE